jgi:hypothetical protein
VELVKASLVMQFPDLFVPESLTPSV